MRELDAQVNLNSKDVLIVKRLKKINLKSNYFKNAPRRVGRYINPPCKVGVNDHSGFQSSRAEVLKTGNQEFLSTSYGLEARSRRSVPAIASHPQFVASV